MRDYFYLLEYKNECDERERLKAKLSEMTYHNLVRRNRGGKDRYAKRLMIDGLIHEKTVSYEEYQSLCRDNLEYIAIKNAISNIDKSIESMNFQAKVCFEKVTDCYNALCSEAKDNNYYKRDGNFMKEGLIHRTLRGDYVRSKSEVFIADVLFINKINYVYECVETEAGKHPDFFIPDNIRGMPVIWEHFGMMDSAEYVQKCLKKLDELKKAGYVVGRNLIITFESYAKDDRRVFDSNKAEQIVKEWFLPEGVEP